MRMLFLLSTVLLTACAYFQAVLLLVGSMDVENSNYFMIVWGLLKNNPDNPIHLVLSVRRERLTLRFVESRNLKWLFLITLRWN